MFLNLPFVVLYSRGCYSLRQCSIVKLRVAKRSVSLFVKWEKGQCENGGGKGKSTNDGQISCRNDRLEGQIPKLGNL